MKSTAAFATLASLTLTACASASGDDDLMASPSSAAPMHATGLDAAVDAAGRKTEGNVDAAPPRRMPEQPDAGAPDAAVDAAVFIDSSSPRTNSSCVGIALTNGGHVDVPRGVPSALGGVNTPKQFEAWVRPESTGTIGLFNVGAGSSCGNPSCGGQHFTLDIVAGHLFVDVGQGGGATTISVPTNEWTFVFAGFDPATGYFAGKVDEHGILSRERVTIGNDINTSLLYPGTRTTLGKDQNNQKLTGIIGGLRAWGRVLSDAEILNRHKVRLSWAERSLVAQWWMEEGTGTSTIDDISGNSAVLTGSATWTTYICP